MCNKKDESKQPNEQEKLVNLCEDMTHHVHDEQSYNLMVKEQQQNNTKEKQK